MAVYELGTLLAWQQVKVCDYIIASGGVVLALDDSGHLELNVTLTAPQETALQNKVAEIKAGESPVVIGNAKREAIQAYLLANFPNFAGKTMAEQQAAINAMIDAWPATVPAAMKTDLKTLFGVLVPGFWWQIFNE